MKFQYILSIVFTILFISLPLTGQDYFGGKNKIQYENFEWRFIQSKHFDVYYYPGGEELAEFTADVCENAYLQLKRDFSFEIRERVVIIVYKSHNDWQQTNVVLSYLEEGIGGVTELYKNRVVVPFEGSYEQFRHVIHHELVHAVMNDMLYGGNIQSLIMGEVIPVPLWVSEGMAEFQSTGWSTRTDMIVRDATLTGYMPPVQYLEYILAYQGGNALFRYVAETYGREKIGEILNKARGKITFQQVLKSSIGQDYEGLTEKWHRWLKKMYWPEVEQRLIPDEFSKSLTDHKKKNNFLNVSPTISPQGDKIAYISDRSGYQNIYLMSALDGKEIKVLVKGNKSESFEELHWLRPGMSFSPDGKRLAFAAKSGAWDAIYLLDIETGNTEKRIMKLDGAFTTSWSPDGNKIAFVGNKDQQSDIYIFDLNSGEIKAITDDVFTDDEPSWSPDGRYLAFVSDRGSHFSNEYLTEDFKMSSYDYEYRDVYTFDLETNQMVRRTNTPWEESSPIFSPEGDKLAYTSDENGIFNIYIQELESGDYYPITNIISGIFQIGTDNNGNKMVFTTWYEGGYDVCMLNNPFEMKPLELNNTQFIQDMRGDNLPVYAREWQPAENAVIKKETEKNEILGESPSDFSNYVFGRYRPKKNNQSPRSIEIADENLLNDEGKYKAHKYKLKFSPDFITGAAGYNTYFGLQGYTSFAFSDLLGDHQIFLNTNLWTDLRNSDFSLAYYYLKRRINYGLGGYHLVYLFLDSYWGIVRYRNFGSFISTAYPFNRFSRLEFGAIWYNVHLEYLDLDIPTEKVSTVLPDISYVHDNVLWGFRWGVLAPVSGSRYAVSFRFSPKYHSDGKDFKTLKFDYRKYFMMSPKYQFAVRANAGASFGKNPQRFFLGGIDNWINRKYKNGERLVDNITDIFFSEFVTPLRGAVYYEGKGERFFLTNLEFRFPLIEYLQLGFPPISLFNIRGVAFYDIGAAWYDKVEGDLKFRATKRDDNGRIMFDDLISGYGIGSRIYFLGFLLRFDIAWNYNLIRSSKPIYYWSLGIDF
jgi:Tol biopolymer transport system component